MGGQPEGEKTPGLTQWAGVEDSAGGTASGATWLLRQRQGRSAGLGLGLCALAGRPLAPAPWHPGFSLLTVPAGASHWPGAWDSQGSCHQQPSRQAELGLHPRGWNGDSVPRIVHCSHAPGRHRSWLLGVSLLALPSWRGPPSGGRPTWGRLVKEDRANVW